MSEQVTSEPKLYWLIEEGSPARYFQREHYGSIDWTADANEAMKFPDEVMAKDFVKGTILRVHEVRICEHMFGCDTLTSDLKLI